MIILQKKSKKVIENLHKSKKLYTFAKKNKNINNYETISKHRNATSR